MKNYKVHGKAVRNHAKKSANLHKCTILTELNEMLAMDEICIWIVDKLKLDYVLWCDIAKVLTKTWFTNNMRKMNLHS